MPFRPHLPSFFPGTFITTPEPTPHPGQHPRQGATPLAHTASYSQPYCCDAAATNSLRQGGVIITCRAVTINASPLSTLHRAGPLSRQPTLSKLVRIRIQERRQELGS